MVSVAKYLKKYGLNQWKINSSPQKLFTTIVVIPVLAEFENLPGLINSLSENDFEYCNSTLILFVVNNLISSLDEIKTENRKTILFFDEINNNTNSSLSRKLNISGLSIAYIDASTENNELPEKDGGVGLARKIGMDIALTLFDYNSKKKKIILCLDADCTVSKNYLKEIEENFNKKNLQAAVVQYRHSIEEGNNQEAIICYEIFLRYYLLGLKYSGSKYAFHTIGSTMVCDYESYIKIEGMNKKKAAEDFYFLEKLAKHVSVYEIINAFVYPSSRGSWRVPFGTGQRVNRFLSKVQNEYLLYNPNSFVVLKSWLQSLYTFNCENELLTEAKRINYSLYEFLVHHNFEKDIKKININSKTNEQINIQKNRWFDGFKTLKLIHHLRDTSFPLQPMFDSLDELFGLFGVNHSIKRKNEIPPITIQKEYLQELRKIM